MAYIPFLHNAYFTAKVGIGTDDPDYTLEVMKASPTDGIVADFVNSTNAGGTTAAIKLSNADAEVCDVVLGANRVGANFGSDFFISPSDGIDGTNRERFRINEDGDIKFNAYDSTNNTGTPTYLLGTDNSGNVVKTNTVPGSGAGPYLPLAGGTMTGSIDFVNNKDISMTDSAGAITRVMVLNTSNTMYIGPVDPYAGGSILYGAAAAVSFQRFFTGASERLRIGSNGNIAIGTTATTYRLQVEQDNNGNLLSRFHNTADNGQGLLIRAGGVSSANRVLQLASENDTKIMTVNSNGRVGIGIANPTRKLQVEGSEVGYTGSTAESLFRLSRGGTGQIKDSIVEFSLNRQDHNDNHPTTQLDFNLSGGGVDSSSAGQNVMTLLSNDNGNFVGIGASSPGYQLQVGDNGVADGNIAMKANGTGADAGAELTFNMNVGGGNADSYIAQIVPIAYDSLSSGTHASLNFKVGAWNNNADAGVSRMTILSNGQVGIGTTNPLRKLDLIADLSTDAVRIKNTNSNGGGLSVFAANGGGGTNRILTLGDSSENIKVAVIENGYVGIGVTSPDTKLHVFEAGTAMIRVDSGATSPYKAGIEFLRSSINGGRIYNDGGAVQIKLESDFAYDAANPTRGGFMFKTAPVTSATLVDAVRIDARGYVGIGTTLPSEKLEVAGNTIINGNGFINGNLSVSNSFIDSNGNSGSSGQVLTSTSSGTSWSGTSGDINTPTQLNLSLGEGYASNVREFLYRNRYRVSPANLSYRYALKLENPSMPEPHIELLPIGGRSGGGLIGTAAAGLLFNISPRSTTLNTSGIFKTQRGTTATVVGSDQYIDVVDINEPRIDFTETTTGDFLMEPSSTNRTVSSVDFSTSSWSVDGVTIASFEGDAPDGSDEASTITEISGDTGRHSCFQVVSSSTSLINTFSFFAKYNGTAQFISIVLSNTTTWNSQFVVDLKNGVITKEASPSSSFTNTNKLEKHGDGWYRLISTIEGDFAGDNIYSRIVMSNVAVPPYPPLNTYTGRNNYNILIWGAQLEQQAFATSFIPTTTSATATRGTEVSQGVQAYHGNYSSGNPQGTLFAEMSALGDNDNTAYNVDTKISLSSTSNTGNDYVTIGFSRFDGNVFAEIKAGGTLQTLNFGATGVDKTKMNKYALAWNDGFMRFFVNGVQTQTSGISAPNINTLQFSSAVTSSQRFIGRVKSLKVYKEMLTAEQLGTLSSWSSFDEMALSQNYTIY